MAEYKFDTLAYRKPFVPSDAQPVIVRSMHYQGEPHPASVKRAIVVPVDKLPLKNEAAVHKFIVLAGPRWSPVPPTDAGVSGSDSWEQGYVKIACEDFPQASQNLKWTSDTLDGLLEEANVCDLGIGQSSLIQFFFLCRMTLTILLMCQLICVIF